MTHIVGKLDSVLQKVADHRQEVMNTVVITSPTSDSNDQLARDGVPSPQTVTLRKHISVDGSVTDSMAPPTPLRERIQNMRLSVSSLTDQGSNFNSLNRERKRKKSPAPSSAESSGEHQQLPLKGNPAKETTTSRL